MHGLEDLAVRPVLGASPGARFELAMSFDSRLTGVWDAFTRSWNTFNAYDTNLLPLSLTLLAILSLPPLLPFQETSRTA